MSCLIIEDEFPAAERLKALLQKVAPQLEILAVLESVAKATDWLRQNPAPDLILSDIQLSDGLSFEIYRKVPVTCPVIFTTAYDQYAIQAFEVHSIDYLLKPVHQERLRKAIEKWQGLKVDPSPAQWQSQLQGMLAQLRLESPPQYTRRFLIEGRDQLVPVEESEVAYFQSIHEVVYLFHQDGRRLATEFTLEQLQQQLDPSRFFRLNRQYIGSFSGIASIHPYFNGRLKLQLSPPAAEVIVSREKAKSFKAWIKGDG